MFYKIGILKNFTEFIRKHLWSLFNKVTGLYSATLVKDSSMSTF